MTVIIMYKTCIFDYTYTYMLNYQLLTIYVLFTSACHTYMSLY